jgi:phage shock protein A
MLKLMNTLFWGSAARAEQSITDRYAADLLEQNVRDAESGLDQAKTIMATLIVRERSEASALSVLEARIADMEARTRAALVAGNSDLAGEAARAIADMDNERSGRSSALAELRLQLTKTGAAMERTQRRIVGLHHGMIQARAVDEARKAQRSMQRPTGRRDSIKEAESLIARILDQADYRDNAEALEQIEARFDHTSIRDRLAASGFGEPTRTTPEDVLARLSSPQAR